MVIAAIEQRVSITPKFYSLGKEVYNPFSKEVLGANLHFNKLVDLCSQAFDTSRIQVYENGDEPFVVADKKDRQYFTVDPITKKKINSVTESQIQLIPTHIVTQDGAGKVFIKEAYLEEKIDGRKKKWIEYWQTDENGGLIQQNGKPIKVDVDPSRIIPLKRFDTSTGQEVKSYTEREIFRDEIIELVSFHFQDEIAAADPNSTNVVRKWVEAEEVAPALIDLITDKKAHIEGVQKSHALNIVSAALQIARNPDTRIKIVSGFGASDKEPSNCYAGNALSALEMANRMRVYFEQRQTQGEKGLTHTPFVELVFAQEAGIQANFPDQADFVRILMAKNMDRVGKFTTELYPDVPVVFNQDIPWSELDPETRAVVRFNARRILHSPSQTIQKTLEELVVSGHTKGSNGSSHKIAAKYSAIHNFVWGDKPNFVPTQYLVNEHPADVVIRIGPRTESKFDAMIMETKNGNPRQAFLDDVRKQGLPEEEVQQIIDSANTHQPNQSPTMIYTTGRIGEHGPTYFFYDYDQPEGVSVVDSIQVLQAEVASLTSQIAENKALAMEADFQTLATRRAVLRARIYDLQAIIATRSSRLTILS